MGLQLTLDKTKNKMFYTFTDAYWAINDVVYTPELVRFILNAYPNRESKLMDGHDLENPSIGYGSGISPVNSRLYTWSVIQPIENIFPNGEIPVGKDAQYTVIYNWIKGYTELPFIDVFEDATNSVEENNE